MVVQVRSSCDLKGQMVNYLVFVPNLRHRVKPRNQAVGEICALNDTQHTQNTHLKGRKY